MNSLQAGQILKFEGLLYKNVRECKMHIINRQFIQLLEDMFM